MAKMNILSAKAVDATRPTQTLYKLSDGGGLYLCHSNGHPLLAL